KTHQPSNYSKQKVKNSYENANSRLALSSHPRMKKLLLAAAVLVGGVAVSQAGIDVRIGLPLPLPRIIVSYPAPYCPPPVVVTPPVCAPRVVVACPPPGYYGYPCRYGYRNQWR